MLAEATEPSKLRELERECIIVGGDMRSRYYLSVLLGQDEFRRTDKEFLDDLRDYFVQRTGPQAAVYFQDYHDCCWMLCGLLKVLCDRALEGRQESPLPKQCRAAMLIMNDPSLTDEEVRETVGTTTRQIGRWSIYGNLRALPIRARQRGGNEGQPPDSSAC